VPSGSLAGFTKSVAPNLRAHSSLFGFVSTAMIRPALTRLAALTTPRPMQPHPKTAMFEPSIDWVSSDDFF
jgi:hypothetical protein